MKEIKVGDILYDFIHNEIVEVDCFGDDEYGLPAVQYYISPKKTVHSSAWIVFKYFIKLGSTN